MSYKLTAEQKEFKSTLRRFFNTEVDSEYLRTRIENKQGADPKLSEKLQELGIVTSFALDKDGGFDLGVRELSLVAYESGHAALPEPLVESALFGSYLLSQLLGLEELSKVGVKKEILEELLSGNARICYLDHAHASALKVNAGKVSGSFDFVKGATGAKLALLVDPSDAKSLYIIDLEANSKELSISKLDALDLTQSYFQVTLNDVPAQKLESDALGLLKNIHITLLASEIAGAAQKAVEMTIEYVKTRKQFDREIGSFQAVQHKLADMYLYTSAMEALTEFAAWSADHSPSQLELASKSAFAFAIEKGAQIIETAIQLHGGTGFTWEFDLHLFLRRVKMLEAIFGSDASIYDDIINAASA
ncbi:MAG: acyl-CoA/acyl-ACP dehydrogenase [Deltaproteobacteria bacterium]|nr:acyl-CoA/acyl-ACP dehydrogenase [Deltaproteobacteria bacterium]